MTAKRYFKRMWEEEYYIFDSETISENEFDEKVEYEDYQAFADSMQGDEVVDLLNEQHETIQRLKDQYERKDRQLKRTKKDIQKYTDYFMNELEWDCDRIIKEVFR